MNDIPNHVAIIMDGNGRWAKNRLLPRINGHKAGAKSVRAAISGCNNAGVKILTLWAFGKDNWKRPKTEVDFLMNLFKWYLKERIEELNKNNVKLRIIGDVSKLDEELKKIITETEKLTSDNTGLDLLIAINYSGRYDLLNAITKICKDVEDGKIKSQDVNESSVEKYLSTNGLQYPFPDLLIRTSGEQRISNFMLWQLAFTEMYFCDVLWPDFREQHFCEALEWYRTRNRRFGSIDSKEN